MGESKWGSRIFFLLVTELNEGVSNRQQKQGPNIDYTHTYIRDEHTLKRNGNRAQSITDWEVLPYLFNSLLQYPHPVLLRVIHR